jgi:hypothetical protein
MVNYISTNIKYYKQHSNTNINNNNNNNNNISINTKKTKKKLNDESVKNKEKILNKLLQKHTNNNRNINFKSSISLAVAQESLIKFKNENNLI